MHLPTPPSFCGFQQKIVRIRKKRGGLVNASPRYLQFEFLLQMQASKTHKLQNVSKWKCCKSEICLNPSETEGILFAWIFVWNWTISIPTREYFGMIVLHLPTKYLGLIYLSQQWSLVKDFRKSRFAPLEKSVGSAHFNKEMLREVVHNLFEPESMI